MHIGSCLKIQVLYSCLYPTCKVSC